MERPSIPGAAKAAIATALSAAVLFGCLYRGAGYEESSDGIPPTASTSGAPESRGPDAGARVGTQSEAQADTRAAMGILKGMGAGGGP